MKLSIILPILFIGFCSVSTFAQVKASEKLYMAKFLLIRLQPAELTETQLYQIEKFSKATHDQVLAIRAEAGITKEVMHCRDSVWNSLRRHPS